MPWWQDNFIANMYGPNFLALYFVVTIAVIVGGWLAVPLFDPTRNEPVIDLPEKPDPYEIAYLRGSDQEVIRVVVFNLLQRGYLTTDSKSFLNISKKRKVVQSPTAPSAKTLNRIEKAVFDFASGSRKPEQFFESRLVSVISLLTAEFKIELTNRRLILADRARAYATTVVVAGMGIIVGLGGYKLIVAISRSKHNVGFLIMIGIAGAIVHAIASRPRRVSNLGNRYIERLKIAFSNTKSTLAVAVTDPMDMSATMAVSVFGLAALGSTPMSDMKDMFSRSKSGSGSSMSSCGAGCGGGGCGGGGCGGCGGG